MTLFTLKLFDKRRNGCCETDTPGGIGECVPDAGTGTTAAAAAEACWYA